jgi:hypothetical protein
MSYLYILKQNNMNKNEILIEQISETNDVQKLELTISALLFGWVMDEKNKEDYVELIEVSVNRLGIVMLLKGEEHPLQHIDLERDGKKIEMSVMMSIMKGMIMTSDEKKMSIFEDMNMN